MAPSAAPGGAPCVAKGPKRTSTVVWAFYQVRSGLEAPLGCFPQLDSAARERTLGSPKIDSLPTSSHPQTVANLIVSWSKARRPALEGRSLSSRAVDVRRAENQPAHSS